MIEIDHQNQSDIQKDFEKRFNKKAPELDLISMWETCAFKTGSVDPIPNHSSSSSSTSASPNSTMICSVCRKNMDKNNQENNHQSSITSTFNPPSMPMHRTSFYKTEICNRYKRYGRCDYGHACTFAHGSHELKQIPNYKTRLCSNFTQKGYCEFGAKCIFLHERSDDYYYYPNDKPIDYRPRRLEKTRISKENYDRGRSKLYYSKSYRL
ncbi:hypothetical protein SSS_10012 [Sarcoptes scabiei]|nr:hypothetical protein SSS_10012 [Sarcoptes scabiei]